MPARTKHFRLEKPMSVHLTLDSAQDSREDILRKAAGIRQQLNTAGCAFRTETVNGTIFGTQFVDKPANLIY
ncbi:hypothetical protein [Paenibacillus sp. y28]|uniref:hypothetical protein n=1 Tax=Paenibacillus sp. y28 TaxID=3129110 RepID=UPI0030181041